MTTTEAQLSVGAKAPDLELISSDGTKTSLASLWPERPLALIFLGPLDGHFASDYAIQWRDDDEHLRESGGDIVAICPDSVEQAAAFRSKWSLPFPVLCVDTLNAYRAFGVTSERPGSFVIHTEGTVRYTHRNDDGLDNPPTWEIVDAVCAVTGKSVERPEPALVGEEAETAAMADAEQYGAPTPGSHATLNFTCAKCGHKDYEVTDVSATSGMMSRMVNLQNRRFSAVSCRRCKYTEFYKTESGALRNIFDLLVGT